MDAHSRTEIVPNLYSNFTCNILEISSTQPTLRKWKTTTSPTYLMIFLPKLSLPPEEIRDNSFQNHSMLPLSCSSHAIYLALLPVAENINLLGLNVSKVLLSFKNILNFSYTIFNLVYVFKFQKTLSLICKLDRNPCRMHCHLFKKIVNLSHTILYPLYNLKIQK